MAAFLGRVAARTVEQLGDVAASKLRQLYEAVRQQFSGDDFATGALDRLEKDPENQHRQQTLQAVLAEQLTGSAEFAAVIARLLEGVEAAGGASIVAVDVGAIAGRDVHMRGRFVAGRDLHVGEGAASAEPTRDEGAEPT